MTKTCFCICEKKGADQLPCNPLSAFVLATYNTSQIHNFKPLAIFCGCTAPFVLDCSQVGNPKDMYSGDVAQIKENLSET